MRIGYLIPEFPSQTHIWMWREVSHMREWGSQITIFSTRRPASGATAKHSFAQAAIEETYYLWPQSPIQLLSALSWAIYKYPLGLWKVLELCFTLELDAQPARWRKTLPLGIVSLVLARKAVEQNIQHFHSHTCSRSAILAMMVKRLVGIPFSMTLNANIEWWGGAMEQKFSDAEFTIAITNWLLAQIRSDYPKLDSDKALLGRIGVDTTKWHPSGDLREPQNEFFKLLTVGRLHVSKGHDVLIRSLKLLLEENRKVDLTIVGSGPDESSLKSLVSKLGIADFVH